MKKGIVYVVLIAVTILATAALAGRFSVNFLTSAVVAAPTAQPYIDMGKFYLTSHNILAARDQFKLAVQTEPANQEANFLYGVTRIAAVAEDGQNLNTSGLDSVREILELSGVTFSKFNLYDPKCSTDTHYYFPGTTPRTGAVLDFLKTKFMPEVDGAIANLGVVVNTSFISVISPASISKASGIVLTADYADTLVTKAMLHLLKCNLELVMVYGPDVYVPNIQSAPKDLMTYKQLFQNPAFLTPNEATRLETARVSLVNFIDTYSLASQYLTARSGSAHHLFVVDVPITNEAIAADTLSLNQFNQALAEIKASLNGPYLSTFAPELEPNFRFVDLSKFFNANNPINLREKLADCTSGTPFPDPTLNGLFPLGVTGHEPLLATYGNDLMGIVCFGRETPKIEVELTDNWVSRYDNYNSTPVEATLYNTGTGILNVSSISLVGSESAYFSLNLDACSSTPMLMPGASCTVSIDLVKSPPYQFNSASLQIVSNDISTPRKHVKIQGYYMQGTGQGPTPANYDLSLSVAGGGSVQTNAGYPYPSTVCSGTCTTAFPFGTMATLVAEANPGWILNGWSGCDMTDGVSCNVGIFTSKNVSASFIHDPKPLVVLASPPGGTYYDAPPEVSLVSSKPATIYYTLNETTPSASSTKYTAPILIPPGGSTTLKYIAIDSFGAVSSVKTESYVVLAAGARLYVQNSGYGSGQVTSDAGGIICSKGGVGVCSGTYSVNSPVTLSVTTLPNSVFTGWYGDCSGLAPCAFAMTTNKNAIAQFGLGPNDQGPMAKIVSTGFSSVNDAYSAAGADVEILAKAGTHTVGTLIMNQGKNITLMGSYNSSFDSASTTPTVLQGTLVIDSGSLRANRVVITSNTSAPVPPAKPGDVIKTLPFPAGITWIGDFAYDSVSGTIWCLAGDNTLLSRIIQMDLAGNVLKNIPNSTTWINHGSEIVHDGLNLWATSYGWSNAVPQSYVYKVSPITGEAVAQFPCPSSTTGGFCEGITWDGSILWSAASDNKNLVGYSVNGTVTQTFNNFYSTTGTDTHLAFKVFPGPRPGVIAFHDGISIAYPLQGTTELVPGISIYPHSSGWDGQNIWRANNGNQYIELVYVGL